MSHFIINIDAQAYKQVDDRGIPDKFHEDRTMMVAVPNGMTYEEFFNQIIKKITEKQ